MDIVAPIVGTVARVESPGTFVAAGKPVAVVESMKMEHPVPTEIDCIIDTVSVEVGQSVQVGDLLAAMSAAPSAATGTTPSAATGTTPSSATEPAGGTTAGDHSTPEADLLHEVNRRRSFGLDENRPEAVAKRHTSGRMTARAYVADLVDPGSFVEYGPLVLAAQRGRRPKEELITKTPGDGLVGGIAEIEGQRCVVMTYDYMVLAGTQGHQNHRKKDRLFELAERLELPVVIFTEGGGGRPGESDGVTVAGLDCLAFALLARLALRVPVVGINTGYCFAGNAALFGMCDIRISTENAYLGMAGPAMIEGGGLGQVAPTAIGPVDDQSANGVLDVVVPDEHAAIATARQAVGFLTGATRSLATRVDPTVLRTLVPGNRRQVYAMRPVLDALFDPGSVLELRPDYGRSIITAFARFDGQPLAVLANDPGHLAGAIDTDSARTASRFLALAEKAQLPVLYLCDTPGFMVGPDTERTGLVEAAGQLFVSGAALTVPFLTVVTRKGYGLGAMAMAGGGFKQPVATVGWPTSEFGAMGLEGFVKLGYRDELAAIDNDEEREDRYEEMVAKMYEVGKGLSMADHFEIDDVIDPAETPNWIRLLF